jgi:putative OPT family oligopeptide transporter
MGWTDEFGKAAALTVGCVVAISASIAGDTSQDLKTGFLLGATPRRQQIGELLGVLTSAVFVCATVLLLAKAYEDFGGFGSEELPAPQAMLMKVVIEGVLDQKLPWILVGIGATIAIAAELLRLPSLPLAVGVYLPVSTMATVFAGGSVRWLLEKLARAREERELRRQQGVLFGSGLVGGEGLMGVLIAGVVFWQSMGAKPGTKPTLPLEFGYNWFGLEPGAEGALTTAGQVLPQIGAVLVFLGLAMVFVRCCRSR